MAVSGQIAFNGDRCETVESTVLLTPRRAVEDLERLTSVAAGSHGGLDEPQLLTAGSSGGCVANRGPYRLGVDIITSLDMKR